MNRIPLLLCIGLIAALAVAWQLGGSLGTGVLAGYVMGGGLTGLGIMLQAHVLRTRPKQAMAASVIGFLAKLAVVLVGALAFRYIEPAARWVDYRSFLVTFAVAAALLLLCGVPGAARELRKERAA